MVMPCSRSAASPSTSSAKSSSSPCVPCFFEILLQRGEQVVVREAGVVQQAADQRRLAVVDRAAGDEAQQRLFAGEPRWRAASGAAIGEAAVHLEISFLFLLFHRGRAVVVDQAALALRRAARAHLLDDLRQASPPRFRSRRSADSSRACGSAPSYSSMTSPGRSFMRSSSTMMSVPSRRTTGRSLAK